MISIKEMEKTEKQEEQKEQLKEQAQERKIKRVREYLQDMSIAASKKSFEDDNRIDDATGAIYEFATGKLRPIYDD